MDFPRCPRITILTKSGFYNLIHFLIHGTMTLKCEQLTVFEIT